MIECVKHMFLLSIIALVFLLLESTVTSLPLFLIAVLLSLILYSSKHSNLVFVLAFLGGLILDASAVRYLGGASLFLTCLLFLVLMYERKYEINTIAFVMVSSFFGIFSYLWIFGYGDIFIQSVIGSFLSGVLFIILRFAAASHQEKLQFNRI